MTDWVGIAATIAALGAAAGGIITASRSKDNGLKQDAAAEKLAGIKAATDGTLSALRADNSLLSQKVDGLERLLLLQTKSADAAATVASVAAAAGAPHPPEG
jgi:hypothetical protein